MAPDNNHSLTPSHTADTEGGIDHVFRYEKTLQKVKSQDNGRSLKEKDKGKDKKPKMKKENAKPCWSTFV